MRRMLPEYILFFMLAASFPAKAQHAIHLQVSSGLVLIPVELEGRSFSFLIDTGSTSSVLDRDTAVMLGLATKGTERIAKNFRELTADVVEVKAVKVGDISFNNHDFAELDLTPLAGAVGTDVNGVLGNDILEKLVFELNYTRQQLLILPRNRLLTTGQSIPLRRKDGQFLISATLTSQQSELVLDTGTNMTSLSWSTWERVNRNWRPSKVVAGVARAGNPTSSAIIVCLPEIGLGNTKLHDQAVRAQTRSDAGIFSSEEFQGILGSDVLRQFDVTFDLEHDRILLKRDPAYKPDPYRYSTIGIQIGKDGVSSYRIMSVWKDSPAFEAGLQQGDLLKFVNGEPIDGLMPDEVSSKLHAKSGTPIKLTIVRDSRESTVNVQTRELLCGR